MSAPFEAKFLGVNANGSPSIGDSVSSTDSSKATIYVFHNTGTHNNHVINIQITPVAGSGDWTSVGSITGVGNITIDALGDEWRLRLATPEGAASNINVYIVGQ